MNQPKGLWQRWKKIAAVIGEAQATLIYTLIYVLVVAPIALVVRLLSDPLARKGRKRPSFWTPRPDRGAMTYEEARRL